MAGVNKVILVGNLGADPEMRYTAGGTAVCKFRIATTEKFKDRQGNVQERTDWHRITAWGKLAEICGQYLAKGKQVYIEGRLEYGSYEKDGVKHYTTDIIANTMQMLGLAGAGNRVQEPEPPFGPPPGGVPEDDIPF
ncbi:MAG: single-stranded DNA-binding protein [Deltaproteobacteria bacterium]|nr:MAG: single-stranded DNA-binding protein [Deltaproteobacteria bacterium]